jgi:hypothetical protein
MALGVCAILVVAASASAQKRSNAENGLVGIKLYDLAGKIVSLYGSPDEIQAVSIGGTAGGGGGGLGGGRGGNPFGGAPGGGFPGAGGPRMGGGGGPRMGSGGKGGAAGLDLQSPFEFGNEVLKQMPGGPGGPPPGYGPGGGMGGYPGAPGGRPGGIPGAGGMPNMGPGGGMPGMGGRGSGGTVNAETATYTRWVYNRNASKYGFIVDKFGHVVQIEAIGIANPKVKTRKGIGFGATFATIIKTYGNPESYEIAGDNITMKYLVKDKVAFRLSRLAEKKPHQVTGVVVAAGKG